MGKNKDLIAPYNRANIFSKLFFTWLNPLFSLSLSKHLTNDDLYVCPESEMSDLNTEKIEREWERQCTRKCPNLLLSVIKAFKRELLISGVFMAIEVVTDISKPVILQQILLGFGNLKDHKNVVMTIFFSIAFILNTTLSVIVLNSLYWITYRLGGRARLATCGLIYKKLLRLNQKSLANSTTGQIINLLSTDTQYFEYTFLFIHYLWSGPLETFITLALMSRITFIPSLITIGVILLIIPIQSAFNRAYGKIRFRTAHVTDQRIRILSDIITGIYVIKVHVWEKVFMKLANKLRSKEIKLFMRGRCFQAFRSSQIIYQVKFTVMILIVAILLLHKGPGDPEALKSYQLFTLMNFITSLFTSVILFMPIAIEQVNLARAVGKRISQFLLLPEVGNNHYPQMTKLKEALVCTNVCSQWQEHMKPFTLNNINFKTSGHELIGIIGSVGSGKSSLLQTILGELPFLSGKVYRSPSIAYLPQVAWIFPGTIRQNILCHLPFDSERYASVLKATNLNFDLSRFPDGDKTCVGERGSGLSGGQKARIALARVAYSRQEILLLDDPLAAVDVRVSNHLFQQCICRFLSDRLRLLVTHQHQLLPYMDRILILKEGEIEFFGTYLELQSKKLQLDDYICDSSNHSEDGVVFGISDDSENESETKMSIKGFRRQLNIYRSFRYDKQDSCDTTAQSPLELEDLLTDGMTSSPLPIYRKHYVEDSPFDNDQCLQISLVALPEEKSITTINVTGSIKSLQTPKSGGYEINDHDKTELNNRTISNGDISAHCESKECIPSENFNHGKVGWKCYLLFGRIMGRFCCLILIPFMFIFTIVIYAAIDMWIARWIRIVDSRNEINSSLVNVSLLVNETWKWNNNLVNMYITIALTIILVFSGTIRTLLFFKQTTYVAKRLHELMLKACLSTRILFFESNPSGWILNRFSKDIGVIDDDLLTSIHDFLQCLTLVVNFCVVTVIASYWAIIPVIILSIFFWIIRRSYMRLSRALKRIEATARSPVLSWVNITLQGLPCIRASGNELLYLNKFYEVTNDYTNVFYINLAAKIWLAIRLDILCVTFIAFISVICLILGIYSEIPGADVGLMFTYSNSLIGLFQWSVRQSAEVENLMVSVERAIEYVELEPEISEELDTLRLDHDWPSHGHIKFQNFGLRYASSDTWALKDINLDIKPGCKVGIVGRTGAGKSTLISALFRLVEGERGCILIDDVNIKYLRLDYLRKRIAIISQDPTLFTGTVRMNMDPLDEKTDEEIWKALESY
ncbi:Multidrug resistance-associated protein 4 [Schistosoma japonicum]|nr:Multidrug resistance-associated protein 4 [Schistosoma japonicum]